MDIEITLSEKELTELAFAIEDYQKAYGYTAGERVLVLLEERLKSLHKLILDRKGFIDAL